MKLEDVIQKNSEKVKIARKEIKSLSVKKELELAEQFNVGSRAIQIKSLELGILPSRYLRNYGTVGISGQQKLLKAKVGIAGAGGLGGFLIEILARMGVGELVVLDKDIFEDNNLNRQIFSREKNLGRSKVGAAEERVKTINSGVIFFGKKVEMGEKNGIDFFAGCEVVCDALDNLSSRLLLQNISRKLKIPMVHGAIGGYCGQVMTIFPGDRGLEDIYPTNQENIPEKFSEEEMGNPSATPAMVAAWQAQEVVKIILGEGDLLRNRMLFFDARLGRVEMIQFDRT